MTLIDVRTFDRDDEPTLEIVLFDYHGEYPLPERPRYVEKAHLMVHEIYDGFAMSQLLGDDEKTDAVLNDTLFNALHPKVREMINDSGGDMTMGSIIVINGHKSRVVELFGTYVTDILLANETGGDDDTFDYWPAAMQTAQYFAAAIDKANNDNEMMRWLRRCYLTYISPEGKNKGPVMEYQFDGDDHAAENADM